MAFPWSAHPTFQTMTPIVSLDELEEAQKQTGRHDWHLMDDARVITAMTMTANDELFAVGPSDYLFRVKTDTLSSRWEEVAVIPGPKTTLSNTPDGKIMGRMISLDYTYQAGVPVSYNAYDGFYDIKRVSYDDNSVATYVANDDAVFRNPVRITGGHSVSASSFKNGDLYSVNEQGVLNIASNYAWAPIDTSMIHEKLVDVIAIEPNLLYVLTLRGSVYVRMNDHWTMVSPSPQPKKKYTAFAINKNGHVCILSRDGRVYCGL